MFYVFAGCVCFLLLGAMTALAAPTVTGPRGSLGIHDPSTIIKHNGRYYMFGTGPGIVSKSSTDGILWKDGPAVFSTPPTWVTNAAPGFNGDFWAPDIAFINGKYCLYYSVSSWGSQQSAKATQQSRECKRAYARHPLSVILGALLPTTLDAHEKADRKR